MKITSYTHDGDIYCPECAAAQGMTQDAPEWGPVFSTGDEADCPQHCGGCHVFLRNALTSDGVEYYLNRVADLLERGEASKRHFHTVREWISFYGLDLSTGGSDSVTV